MDCSIFWQMRMRKCDQFCASIYHMKQNKALIMVLNLEKSVFAITRALLSNLRPTKTQLKVPNGGSN